jgi:hypothetical protein
LFGFGGSHGKLALYNIVDRSDASEPSLLGDRHMPKSVCGHWRFLDACAIR